jgi:hypothetical protein
MTSKMIYSGATSPYPAGAMAFLQPEIAVTHFLFPETTCGTSKYKSTRTRTKQPDITVNMSLHTDNLATHETARKVGRKPWTPNLMSNRTTFNETNTLREREVGENRGVAALRRTHNNQWYSLLLFPSNNNLSRRNT